MSLGAQKNFIDFAERARAEYEDRPDDFNERWFQQVVARAIVFLSTEDLVSSASWYPGGYRRNIVTYAIARCVRLIEQSYPKYVLDLDRIWKAQAISRALADQILLAARVAAQQLTNPPEPWKNVTEWAKKERCWELVAAAPVEDVPGLLADLRPVQEERADRSDARDQAQEDDAIDSVTQAVRLGADGVWRKAFVWPNARRLLSPVEYGILTTVAAARNTWVPSDLQARRLMSALKKLQEDGFV